MEQVSSAIGSSELSLRFKQLPTWMTLLRFLSGSGPKPDNDDAWKLKMLWEKQSSAFIMGTTLIKMRAYIKQQGNKLATISTTNSIFQSSGCSTCTLFPNTAGLKKCLEKTVYYCINNLLLLWLKDSKFSLVHRQFLHFHTVRLQHSHSYYKE